MWCATQPGYRPILVVTALLGGIVTDVPARCSPAEQARPAPDKAAVQERLNRVRSDLFSRPDRATDAIAELKAILAVDPESAEGHLLLGIAYRMKGSPEFLGEAAAELRQALALEPQFAPARYYLAQLYLQLGRARRAREEMQTALEQSPNHPQFLGTLGEAERQLGNARRAVELTRRAVQADESFAEARYYLGLALFDLGQRDDAIRELERVVQSGPPVAEPYLSLGTAYLEAARVDEALTTLNRGLEINPSKADIRIQLARGYRLKGLLAKADAELKLASPAEGAAVSAPFAEHTEFDFLQEQGLLRVQQKRLDAARDIFHKLLQIDPNHGPTNRHLADVYLRQGSFKQALEYATRAEKLGFPLPADRRKLLDVRTGKPSGSGRRK